eukprot:g4747.t1
MLSVSTSRYLGAYLCVFAAKARGSARYDNGRSTANKSIAYNIVSRVCHTKAPVYALRNDAYLGMAKRAGSFLVSVPKKHAFTFGVLIAGVKNGIADVIVQTVVDGRSLENIDRRRVALFSAFGTLFCGVWQYALFVKIMPRVVPTAASFAAKPLRAKMKDAKGLRGLLFQVFIENGINNPILYFPTFYAIKSMLRDDVYDLSVAVPLGVEMWKEYFWSDVPAILKVWVPAQLINFAFCPMWLRVPRSTISKVGDDSLVSQKYAETQDNRSERGTGTSSVEKAKEKRKDEDSHGRTNDLPMLEDCFDVHSYAANKPSEDDYICTRQRLQGSGEHVIIFAVIDGHGGRQCVDFLKKRLSDIVFQRLELLTETIEKIASVEDVEKELLISLENVDREFVEHAVQVKASVDARRERDNEGSGEKDDPSQPRRRKRSRRRSSKRRPPQIVHAGACVIMTVVFRGVLHVCNAGDCRAMWTLRRRSDGDALGAGGSSSCDGDYRNRQCFSLSRDHKCSDAEEAATVRLRCTSDRRPIRRRRDDRGFDTVEDTFRLPLRVAGSLAVTRAVGDSYLKVKELSYPPYANHVPYLQYPCRAEISSHAIPRDSDCILVLASDGLWDHLDCDLVTAHITEYRSQNDGRVAGAAECCAVGALHRAASAFGMAAEELYSLKRGQERRSYHDDVTVLVVSLDGALDAVENKARSSPRVRGDPLFSRKEIAKKDTAKEASPSNGFEAKGR